VGERRQRGTLQVAGPLRFKAVSVNVVMTVITATTSSSVIPQRYVTRMSSIHVPTSPSRTVHSRLKPLHTSYHLPASSLGPDITEPPCSWGI
jgi:hypothetical protein